MSSFDLSDLGEDFTQYERTVGTGSTSPLPIGFYAGIITRADMKDTRDGSGKYLEVEFDITSPSEHSNRKFWDKFNLVNRNNITVKIAKEQLGDLLKALGFNHSPNTEELVGKEVCMYLGIEPAKGQYKETNKCLKYLPTGSSEVDYQEWLTNKRGAMKASHSGGERKTWGGGAAATAVDAVKTAQPTPARAAWKKQKQ